MGISGTCTFIQKLIGMKRWIILAAIMTAAAGSNAQKAEVFSKDGKAIRGFDPVAYFTQGKPVKGNDKLHYKWKDATWYFSSQQNLDAFKNAPEKYAPQYGGYCAYGLSNGYKATTEPDAWSVVNGKLYLNYDTGVRNEWNKTRDQRIKKADENWPQIKNKE
jgi:YHS domain-containing protein